MTASPRWRHRGCVKNRIIDIARWDPVCRAAVYSSRRSGQRDRPHQQASSDSRVEENGRAIPVECFFMPKSVGEPALEVADFVMMPWGARRGTAWKVRTDSARLRRAFHDQDPKRVSFMDVNAAKRSA